MNEHDGYKQIIEKWILSIMNGNGIERFEDLHIDRIDSRWKDRSLWIEKGVQVLKLAAAIRDDRGLSLTVALAFSLIATNEVSGIDFNDISELEKLLDWSPPSIYLFHLGEEPWASRGQREGDAGLLTKFDCSKFGVFEVAKACHYFEFKQDDTGAISRSVFLEA